MTEIRHKTDLFSPKYPYSEHESGSQLNNFLVEQYSIDRSCVIFLDEIKKSTKEVWNLLLIPFDTNGKNIICRLKKSVVSPYIGKLTSYLGSYTDHRSPNKVSLSMRNVV